jgi:hypothetical protein
MRAAAVLASLLWLAAASPAAARDDFAVERFETRVERDRVVLDARIDYDFSDAALEALDSGVPLTLDVHVQVRPADAWVWQESLVDQHLRYLIRYRPLSEHYLVTRLPASDGRSYVTRDAAIAALGEIDDLDLVHLDRLEPDERYEVHLRASLDVEELPLPLKPIAYLHPAWKLSTGWTRWPLLP